MSDLMKAIHEFAGMFDHLRIPYAIMGGWAVRLYGLPRPTYDIDFTITINRGRLADLYNAVANLGYTVPDQFLAGWVDRVADMPLVKFRLYVDGHSLDVDVFLAESPYQEELMRRRRLHELQGREVSFVTPEDLVLLKLIAARPRDLGDIEDVLLAKPDIDEAYMRRWAGPLGVAEKLEEILAARP